MRVVEVRDKLNPERLLGSMLAFTDRPIGRYVQACAPTRAGPFSALYADVAEASVETISFEYGWHASPDGWDRVGHYETRATLEQLLGLERFRLPGEQEWQARERWRLSRWPPRS